MACSVCHGDIRRSCHTISDGALWLPSFSNGKGGDDERIFKFAQVPQEGPTSAFHARKYFQELGGGAGQTEAANLSSIQGTV